MFQKICENICEKKNKIIKLYNGKNKSEFYDAIYDLSIDTGWLDIKWEEIPCPNKDIDDFLRLPDCERKRQISKSSEFWRREENLNWLNEKETAIAINIRNLNFMRGLLKIAKRRNEMAHFEKFSQNIMLFDRLLQDLNLKGIYKI